jgi:pantoate kinase
MSNDSAPQLICQVFFSFCDSVAAKLDALALSAIVEGCWHAPDILRRAYFFTVEKDLRVKEKWPFGAGLGFSGRAALGFHQT